MWELICKEARKLYRNKINWILVVGLLAFTVFFSYKTYQPDYQFLGDYGNTIIEKDGSVLSQKELIRYSDELAHHYAGTPKKKLISRIMEDYQTVLKEAEASGIDEDAMREAFGGEYIKTIKPAMEKGLSKEEYDYFNSEYGIEMTLKEDGRYYPTLIYKDEYKRYIFEHTFSINKEYVNNASFWTESDNAISIFAKDKKYTKSENVFFERVLNHYEKVPQELKKAIHELYLNQDSKFDSTVSNNIFLNTTGLINVFTLVVIGLMSANLFSADSRHKVDQIIVSSPKGGKQMVIARVICGVGTTIVVVGLQWLILFAMNQICLPIRDWSLTVMPMASDGYLISGYLYTYLEVVLGMIGLSLVAGIITSLLAMAISYFTHHQSVSIACITLFLLVPVIVPFGDILKINWMNYVFPSKLIETYQYFYFYYDRMPYFMMGDTLVSYYSIMMALYIVIGVALVAAMAIYASKHRVKNR